MREKYKEIYGINMEATGKRIACFIDDSGLSDKEIGSIMGLTVQSVNKWRHARSIPDIENLYILSRILGVKIDDFIVPRKQPEKEGMHTITVVKYKEEISEVIDWQCC